MSTPYTNSGAKIYVAPAVYSEPADATAYAALVWTQIGDVESYGQFGDESQILTAMTLEDKRVFKAKGPRDAGTLEIVCLHREDDAGQQAMVAAEKTEQNYPIKIELPNKLTSGGSNSLRYMMGPISSRRIGPVNPTAFGTITFNVAINSQVVEVAAT